MLTGSETKGTVSGSVRNSSIGLFNWSNQSLGRQGARAPSSRLSVIVAESMQNTNTPKWTTITVQRDDVESLDEYAERKFGTDELSYRAIIHNLLSEVGCDE